jgi:hypothetical protein
MGYTPMGSSVLQFPELGFSVGDKVRCTHFGSAYGVATVEDIWTTVVGTTVVGTTVVGNTWRDGGNGLCAEDAGSPPMYDKYRIRFADGSYMSVYGGYLELAGDVVSVKGVCNPGGFCIGDEVLCPTYVQDGLGMITHMVRKSDVLTLVHVRWGSGVRRVVPFGHASVLQSP